MYYVITVNRLITGKTLKEINRKINGNLEITDFKSKGQDYIINLNNDDIDFIQDRKKMGQIMVQNLFKKSESGMWMLYIILGLQLILMLK